MLMSRNEQESRLLWEGLSNNKEQVKAIVLETRGLDYSFTCLLMASNV
jgi:hypothetical protein